MLKKALVFVSTLFLTLPATAQLLDEPEITPVNDMGEIHINFTTPITYLRHFPQDIGETVRIFIDVTDPCADETIRNQEHKNYPAGGLVNPFKITFPEIISGNDNGNSTCATTKTKNINTNETILLKFEGQTIYQVRLGEDNHSIIVTTPLRPGAEVKVEQPKLKVPVPPEGASAETLMKSAKAATDVGEFDSAIEMYNRVLNMPPNSQSQPAQELIGAARELNRDLEKAKIEYELYLKLYPNTDGAKRVEARLAGINAGKPIVSAIAKPKKTYKEGSEVTTFGSLSQYYYGSRTDTHLTGQPTTRRTEQSALVTSFDITSRWRHNQYDDKLVIRDQQTHNFPPGVIDANRLTSAYWDHEDKEIGFMTRLGRQPGNSQGILGRFDGVFGRYTINPTWKITGVAGVPDDGTHSTIQTNRHFYGSALEFAAPGSNFSGNVYAIQQVADKLVERRAVGTELRYFKDKLSVFSLLDYDTVYNEFNIALIQANWTAFNEINFNALLDHRKTPILYSETAIRTAAPSSGAVSVADLRRLFTNRQIYDNVNAITADTDTALFGATKQVSLNWQLGGDVRASRTSATKDVTDNLGTVIVGSPASGTSYTYSAQAIGTGTIFKDDTSVISASYIDDPTFQGQTFGITHLATFRTKYKVDTSFNLFHSRTNTAVRTVKMTPAIRLAYQWRENTAFEAEFGVEKTLIDDPIALTHEKDIREFMFVGYRWDY